MRTVRPITWIAFALSSGAVLLLFVDIGLALPVGIVGLLISAYCVVTSPAP